MTVPADPPVIDLDKLIVDGALINAPSKELVHVPNPLPDLPPGSIRLPLKRRFREFMVDGRAIIYGMCVVYAGLAATFIVTLTMSIVALVQAFIAALPVIIGTIALLLLVLLLCRPKKGPDALVLKGCNNGPTPGAHTVKLCNGRH